MSSPSLRHDTPSANFCLYRALPWLIVLGVFCIAMAFAYYTDHRWEDFYTAFRSSKNLAAGNGLVYTVGQKIQSFTSPIGVLLPALLSYLLNDDTAVIWAYRAVCSLILGLASVQLLQIARHLQFSARATIFTVALFATNILILDFSISGMEVPFMMLGLTYYLRLMLTQPAHMLRKLSLVIAALMYTRPDSFVYVGCIAFGFFVFDPTLGGAVANRRRFALLFLKAGTLAFLLYLPWFAWAWAYYGNPIPHSVIAKSGLHYYSWHTLQRFLIYPALLISGQVPSNGTSMLFLPAYAALNWIGIGITISRIVCCAAMFYFLLNRGSAQLRSLSVAAYLCSFYLEELSGQSALPWYLPNLALIVVLALALLYHAGVQATVTKRMDRVMSGVLIIALLLNSAAMLTGAYEMRMQQRVIENGTRTQVGLWLNEHARTPNDTVLLECVGYIGFYSNLKMFDYPGITSPESVAAIRKVGLDNFAGIITELKPDWLVLRPKELGQISEMNPAALDGYELRKQFDARPLIPATLPGRGYLEYDAQFNVYARKH